MDIQAMQELTINYLQVFLGVFTVVGSAVIGLIIYIWAERKKQIDTQHEIQTEFNNTLSSELGELKTQNVRLEEGLSTVSDTMGGLKNWLVTNERKHAELDKSLLATKMEVKNIKEDLKSNYKKKGK